MLPEADALAAARDTLPLWVGLGSLALLPYAALVAFLAAVAGTSIALLANRGVPRDAHWTERARRSYPARALASQLPMLSALLLGMLVGGIDRPLSIVPAWLLGLLTGVAAFCGAYPLLRSIERRTRDRRPPLRESLAAQTFVFLVLFPHLIVVLVAASAMPAEPLRAGIGGAIVLAILVAIALGGGLRAAIALGLVRPAGERLLGIVSRASASVGVQARGVWTARWRVVNAFAFPRTGDLLFTEEAVESLTDDELAAITAHELGHLGEPRSVVFVRSLGLCALFPVALIRPIVARASGDPIESLLSLLLLLCVTFALTILVRTVSRKMEERADAVAHAHQGEDGTYARALERIYELNLVPAVMLAKQSVHPHLYDRLVSAGVTPSYPRPAPPPRAATVVGTLAAVAILVAGAFAWEIAFTAEPATEGEEPPLVVMALHGGSEQDLDAIGRERWARGDLEGALPCYRALAARYHRGSPYYATELARLLAWSGDCDGARAVLDDTPTPYNGSWAMIGDARDTVAAACDE